MEKIIDAHMHIVDVVAGIGAKGELRAIGDGKAIYSNGDIINIIPKELGDKSVSAESLISLMDKNNVNKAVLLQGNYLGFQNIASYNAMKKYPNRFLAAASVDPFCRNAKDIIKYLFEDLKIKVLKLELSNTSGLMCNHDTVLLDCDKLRMLYDKAKELGLVVAIDIGRPGSDSYQVETLSKIIKEYSSVKFVICHLTAPQYNDFEILKSNLELFNMDNCYFDIASLHCNTKPEEYPFNRALEYLRYAIDYLGSKKLLWGSDVPSAMTRLEYNKMISYIKDSNLFTKQELEDLFYNNASRVYFNEA